MKLAAASLVLAALPFVPFRTGRSDWTARQHLQSPGVLG